MQSDEMLSMPMSHVEGPKDRVHVTIRELKGEASLVRQWFDLADPLFATWVQSPDLNDVHYGSRIRGPEHPTEMYSRICLEPRLQAGQSMYGLSNHASPLSCQMIDDRLTNGPTHFLSMFYIMYVA